MTITAPTQTPSRVTQSRVMPEPRTDRAVYADFTSAACYLASLRTDRLLRSGRPAPDWRMVELRPRLPLKGIRLSASAQAFRARELAATREQLMPGEEFEARNPRFLPNTRAAVAAYAEAYEVGIADLARSLLFDAYWVQGADIGDPQVLRRLLAADIEQARATTDPPVRTGYVVSIQGGPVSTAAYRRIDAWQSEWLNLGIPAGLTVVSAHLTDCGPAALRSLTSLPGGVA